MSGVVFCTNMARPIRPDALESIIHDYENIKSALDAAEATLQAINDELVPLEQRRDALRQHHDEQSKIVDDLQGRLMVSGQFNVMGRSTDLIIQAMFDPSSMSSGTSQGQIIPSQDQGDVLQQKDLKRPRSESPNDYEVYNPPPASKRLELESVLVCCSLSTSKVSVNC